MLTKVFARFFSVNNQEQKKKKRGASSIVIEPLKFVPTNQMKMETRCLVSKLQAISHSYG